MKQNKTDELNVALKTHATPCACGSFACAECGEVYDDEINAAGCCEPWFDDRHGDGNEQ